VNRWRTWFKRRRGLGLALVVGAVLVPGSVALGASPVISLTRTPAPPAAAKVGTGVVDIGYEIRYDSRGERVLVDVLNASGNQIAIVSDRPLSDANAQAGRVVTSADQPAIKWTPPVGTPAGRYEARVQFFAGGVREGLAQLVFEVAPQIGNLRVTKYEDVNGNAVRDAGEPGVTGWQFEITSPSGIRSTVVTDSAGVASAAGVAAGEWTVTELPVPGWIAGGATTARVIVPVDGTGDAIFGNLRPGTISGVVFIDTNRNGRQDTGEIGRAGATVTLGGTRGNGSAQTPTQAVTAADGSYSFTGLIPGTYGVTASQVTGFTFTTPTSIPNIQILSNGSRPNNNFGIISSNGSATPPTTGTIQGSPTAPTTISIAKSGPATFVPGQSFVYRITVRNTGRQIARNVVVTDPVPNLVTLVRVPTGAKVVNGVVTWSLGNLAPGAVRRLVMTGRLAVGAPAGDYRNTATAVADNARPVQASTTGRLRKPNTTSRRSGGVTG
jgi:uncharacterized repeat protein (TIGR01451 family)